MSKGERTKAEIVQIGLQVWRETPDRVNASHIASLIGITHAAVLHHYKSSGKLRTAIAEHAVRTGDPIVIPMLLAARHPAVSHMTTEQKAAYLGSL